MVGLARLELATSRLSSVRSNQLSYKPLLKGKGRHMTFLYHVRRDMKTAAYQKMPHTKHTLRKEVIQPQVPLRLPCYDLAPVANPTVAGCLLKG